MIKWAYGQDNIYRSSVREKLDVIRPRKAIGAVTRWLSDGCELQQERGEQPQISV
jgi:hypothetical protein